jgi:hypothetical protein
LSGELGIGGVGSGSLGDRRRCASVLHPQGVDRLHRCRQRARALLRALRARGVDDVGEAHSDLVLKRAVLILRIAALARRVNGALLEGTQLAAHARLTGCVPLDDARQLSADVAELRRGATAVASAATRG